MPAPKTKYVPKSTEGPVEGTDPEIDSPEQPAAEPAPRAPVVSGRPKPVPVGAGRPTAASAQLPRVPLPIVEGAVGGGSGEEPLPTVSTSDGRKVALLLPQYKQTNPLTLYSLCASWDRSQMGLMLNWGDAFIIHSRNRLAHRFVEERKFEWALFVDDDMVLPCGNASLFRKLTGWDIPDSIAGVRAADRLISHGKTLVGGLYFGRNPYGEGKPMFSEGFHQPAVAKEVRNVRTPRSVRPTGWVGTGCLLVHRSVFEAIRDKFPHLRPTDPSEPFRYFSPAPDGVLSRVYAAKEAAAAGDLARANELLEKALLPESMINAWAGEDVVFCNRARMVGHQPHVDTGVICGHVGSAVWGPMNTV